MRAFCSGRKKPRNDLKESGPKLTVLALIQRMETSHQRTLKLFVRVLVAAKDLERGDWEVLGKIKWEMGRCSTGEKFSGTQNIPQEERGRSESVQ